MRVDIFAGKSGQFDVLVGNTLVASKQDHGISSRLGPDGFPDPDWVVQAVDAHLGDS